MIVRAYRRADLESVVDVFTNAIQIGAAAHYDEFQRLAWAPLSPDLQYWETRLAGLTTLVAEHECELVGFISYAADGHIDLLFTAPHRTRAGVASALYREVESNLRATNVRKVFTEASLAARPFFERHGFTVVATENVERRGAMLPRFRMHKLLDQ